MSAGFALLGSTAAPLLFGSKFKQATITVCLIGILQTTRFVRLWPNTVALAMGRSVVVLINNVARLVGIPIALAAVFHFHSVVAIVSGLIVGEYVALAMGIAMTNRAADRPALRDFDRFAILALGSVAIILCVYAWRDRTPLYACMAFVTASATAGWSLVRENATIVEAASLARRWLLWRPASV
jgi:hypothetical protein